jgi:hypothetical protein
MKGASNLVSGIHCLKQAYDHFISFILEHPGTKGSKMLEGYNKRIKWIFTDISTNPLLPESVREGIKNEWNGDVFSVPAISEKVALLNPDQRELVETLIDGLLEGKEVRFGVEPNE